MIYFIQDSTSGAIKIGVSKNPLRRLADLQTAHAHKLRLLGITDGMQQEEQELHSMFDRLEGEWFRPTDMLLSFIREHAITLEAFSPPRLRKPMPRVKWRNVQNDTYFALLNLCCAMAIVAIAGIIAPALAPSLSFLGMVGIGAFSFVIIWLASLHVVARNR